MRQRANVLEQVVPDVFKKMEVGPPDIDWALDGILSKRRKGERVISSEWIGSSQELND